MTLFRCTHDVFCYCNGEPQWKDKPKILENDTHATMVTNGVCELTPDSCGKHQTHLEKCRADGIPEVVGSGVRIVKATNEETAEKKEKKKAKENAGTNKPATEPRKRNTSQTSFL